MMAITTLRVELARHKMTVTDLIKKTGLARETVTAVLDGDYSRTTVKTLQAVAEALPGLRLTVRLENDQ